MARDYDLDEHVRRTIERGQRGPRKRKEPVDQLSLFELEPKLVRPPIPHGTTDGLVPGDDMLFSRLVSIHSLVKAAAARAYAEMVGIAIGGKRPLWWIELFAGPGQLLVRDTGVYAPGSPVEALSIRRPFNGYVFCDLNPACTESLRRRIGDDPRVTILRGDANSAEILTQIAEIVPRNALVVAYIDPEGLDHAWPTNKFFIDRYPHLDLLLNLPVSGIVRAVGAGHSKKASSVLDIPDAVRALGSYGSDRGDVIRDYYCRRLEAEGFNQIHGTTIKLRSKNVDLYDLLLASRHPLAKKFFEAAVAASEKLLAA
jgi:three-Cys-motif partner protein